MNENGQLSESQKMDEMKSKDTVSGSENRRNALKRMAKVIIGGAGLMMLPRAKIDAGNAYVPPIYSKYFTYTTYSHSSYGSYGSYGSYFNYRSTNTNDKSGSEYSDYSVYSSYYSSYSSTCLPKNIYTSGYSSTSATCEYCDSNDEKQDFSYSVCYSSTQN